MKKTFYLTVIVLAFLLCSSQTIVCPPTGYSIYPDMEDCTAYYECDNGFLIHQECPDGLLFNQDLGVCDWPFVVNCDGRPIPEESGGDSGDYYYWKELEDQNCVCVKPEGGTITIKGTACVTNGKGNDCNNYGLCNISGYSFCSKVS